MSNKDHLEAEFEALNQLYRKGQISPDDYYKCLVALAWEYIAANDLSQAVTLLNIPSKEYYALVQRRQMEADASFYEISLDVANALVERGIVNLRSDIKPNQAPALA